MAKHEREAQHPGYTLRWWIVAVVLVAEIVDMLDSTVVNVAGPTLRQSLGSTATQLEWVIGGYTLALGSGLIVGGRLGDRFGRRQMFLLGIVGFTVASVLCAVSPTIDSLIVFRLIQGFMGAILIPQGFGLMMAAFPREDFGKAFAAYGPVFGIAGILGPIIGGGIIQANVFDLSWRAVFLINLPLGVAGIIIAWIVLPRVPGDKAVGIDIFGALVIIGASALLVWPLIQGQDAGWPAWTWISMATSLVGIYLFVILERRSAKRGHTPLVEPTVFTRRSFVYGVVGIALYFGAIAGFQLINTLFFQIGHRYSAGEAGLANIPMTVGFALGGLLSGAVLAEKLGRRAVQLGAVVMLVGLIGFVWLISAFTFNYWMLVPALAVIGFGGGLITAALFTIALAGVEGREAGSASGLVSSVQSVFGSVGVALTSAIFFTGFSFLDIAHFDAAAATRNALFIVMGFIALFLVLSPKFPNVSRD